MVRTARFGEEEDDVEEDKDFASTTPDVSPPKGKLEKNGAQKVNAVRSKHSETEQRRRSKINERFQILRDLVPENDQKRDKASFLLEVIQYIQLLQARIQMYEGTCQGWSPEPSKLMAWRSDLSSIDNFLDQPQLIRNGSGSEDNIAASSKLLTSSQNSIDSDLSGGAQYRTADAHVKENNGMTPVQPNLFEVASAHPSQGSFPEPDYHLEDQFHSQSWLGKSSPEYGGVGHDTSKPQKRKPASEEAGISHEYSQVLLNTLSHALRSSGVDLSLTNISVQLDVSKTTDGEIHTTPVTQDDSTFQEMGSYLGAIENYDHAIKKLKTLHS